MASENGEYPSEIVEKQKLTDDEKEKSSAQAAGFFIQSGLSQIESVARELVSKMDEVGDSLKYHYSEFSSKYSKRFKQGAAMLIFAQALATSAVQAVEHNAYADPIDDVRNVPSQVEPMLSYELIKDLRSSAELMREDLSAKRGNSEKTDASEKKEVEINTFNLNDPQMVDDEILKTVIRYYRSDLPEKRREEYVESFINAKNKYAVNPELMAASIHIPEGSFQRNPGKASGRFNFGNIRDTPSTFGDYKNLDDGMESVPKLLDKYVNGKIPGYDAMITLDEALPAYCTTHKSRLPVAKEYTVLLRKLSEKYTSGKITKEQLPDEFVKEVLQVLEEKFPEQEEWFRK
jgi:hypothetical protein